MSQWSILKWGGFQNVERIVPYVWSVKNRLYWSIIVVLWLFAVLRVRLGNRFVGDGCYYLWNML